MILSSAAATETLGAALGRQLVRGDVIALFGDLGAGKTTFARGIARGLGFQGDVGSPTFPIVQIYDNEDMRLPLWHIDLYRIEHSREIDELGLDEAREEAVLAIEWPERLGHWLWPDSLKLSLSRADEERRVLTAQLPAAWETRWPPP